MKKYSQMAGPSGILRLQGVDGLRRIPRNVLLALMTASLAGCSILQQLSPDTQSQLATSVAQTVAAQAPPPSPLPPTATTGEQVSSPTFTSTSVVAPTNTLEQVITPTFTWPPLPNYTPVFPTLPAPTSAYTSCCTLRVRNVNRKVTYWIGTSLPYGGSFIEPLHYVEFYPKKETWMRIYWCRRINNNRWTDDAIDDFFDHYQNELRYWCDRRDVFVDQPLEEISVQ